MLRLDAHFGDNEIVDPFMSLGIGYRTTANSYTSDRLGYVEEPTETLIPISFRLAAGANIYVVENIGVLLELDCLVEAYFEGWRYLPNVV